MLISFREGLEAFLVVGIILAYLGRMGMLSLRKWVYLGVGLGVFAAFALAFVFQVVLSGFESSLMEKYLKAGIMGFAVIVLTYVMAWMSRNSRVIKGAVEQEINTAVSAGNMIALMLVAFFAVVREGLETVLFLGALYGGGMDTSVLAGVALGLALSLLAALALFRGMKGLPVKTFFRVTGLLVLVISAGLLVNMIGILQDINAIPLLAPGIIDLSWLLDDNSTFGIFLKALFGYTARPSLAQVLAYTLYITVAYLLIFRKKDAEKPLDQANLAHAR
ncbi:MAG: FTR1 family protein [Nitrospinota bacterium]|nr:FTR1 family protein [Nitrospinota bacterium]